MGNCLVLQDKVVTVMKADGKILEYKSPIKVHQVLSEYAHHAVSDKLPVVKHLHPNTEMRRGHLYYLVPVAVKEKKLKTVHFSDEVKEMEGVVRIKLVISKQELQAMLNNDDALVSHVQRDERTDAVEDYDAKNWSPALESIPEVN